MTNIIIRYDPQLIFDQKISPTNGDLKLIMNGASFESDPQIHLRLLYILFNVVEIKPSNVETSEIIIDFLMNIYNFRYVLTMDDSYDFLIQTCQIATSFQHVSKEKESLLSLRKNAKEDQADLMSVNSKAVPLSEKNGERISKQKSNTSEIRDTIEEEESKLNSEEFNESNPFYFENEEFALCKIDGLRMSLCMSITILSRLSSVNKRANCTQIFNSKFDKFEALFDYFHPLINLNTNKCNKYITSVLEIIQRAAEMGKLEDIILRKDTVKHLVDLLKVVIERNLNDMVLMILKTFFHLTTEQRFHSDLFMQNPMSLLDSNKLRDNEDKEIKQIANDLFESVVKNSPTKYNYIVQFDSEELKNIKEASLTKQLAFLKNFEEAMQQNKVKLDQLSEGDIESLIQV